MIGKDIYGNNLPNNYGDYISADSRDFDVKLVWYDFAGDISDWHEINCAISRLTITKGACGSTENFSIGNVITSSLSVEIKDYVDDPIAYSIQGKLLGVHVGLKIGSDYVYVPMGQFKAVEVKYTFDTCSIVAYGHTLSSTAGSFTSSSKWISDIFQALGSATGITVGGDLYDAELSMPIPSETSCYSALQILAQSGGAFAMDTYNGNIEIRGFMDSAVVDVDVDRMLKFPDLSEMAFRITGVQVTATGQFYYTKTTDVTIDPDKTYYTRSGTAPDYVYTEVEDPDVSQISNYYERFESVYRAGDPIVLYDENPYMSQDAFYNYLRGIMYYDYYYGNVDLSLGDPRLEGNDTLNIYMDGDYIFNVPCHQITHTYDGGWATHVVAANPTLQEEGIPQTQPISQKIDGIAYSAQVAQSSAESAQRSAKSAQTSAQSAVEQAQIAYDKAQEVNALATEAKADAQIAKDSASIAYGSAQSALTQLAMVEDVVGTLNWIAEHGIYVASTDTEVVDGKVYYTLVGTAITNPTGNPHRNGYYELISGKYVWSEDTEVDSQKTYYQVTAQQVAEPSGNPSTIPYYELEIDEAVVQYINTHLALTDRGLSVTDGSQSSMLISSDGVTIYGSTGQIVGQYGEGAIIGNTLGYHIEITTSDETQQGRLSFKNVNTEIAYMTNNELYIPRVVVVDSMQIGNWIWDAISSVNHLTLKWKG